MTQAEFQELRVYVRDALREQGLDHLDAQAYRPPRHDDEPPAQLLFDYLHALDTELALRSRSTVERTIDRLNGFVVGEGGVDRPIDAVTVELDAAERADTGLDLLDLARLPDLEPVRQLIQELLVDLQDETERG